jgi:IclR family acetate operon transcriptional repressor
LERVRAQGYAVDNEEISRGLTCIGAPIFGVDGKIIAALSLTAPSYIYERGIPSSVINTVQSHAAQASLK